MSSLSGSGSNSSGNGTNNSGTRVGEQTEKRRADYLTDAKGAAIGGNYTVDGASGKPDFAKFMGIKPATADELSGTVKTDARRAMELAMAKEVQELGVKSAKSGNAARNQFVAGGQFSNQPGHDKHVITDMRDAINESLDKNSLGSKVLQMGSGTEQYFARVENMQKASHNDNVKYLEMQYKFQEISKQDSTISNLMKTRHDAVSRTIRGGQG